LLMFVFACGGSSSSGGGYTPPKAVPTPPGTYGLTITASTGGAQSTYIITLKVN
jgi:hypothetical protein